MTNQFHYYRPTRDGRILWGGYDAIYHFGRHVRPSYDQRPATFDLLAAQFFETFPQLAGLRFSHALGRRHRHLHPLLRLLRDRRTAGARRTRSGFTGLGVGATRFGADVMLDLLDGLDTERTRLRMVREKPLPFPPEPLAWAGIELTRRSLAPGRPQPGRPQRLAPHASTGWDSASTPDHSVRRRAVPGAAVDGVQRGSGRGSEHPHPVRQDPAARAAQAEITPAAWDEASASQLTWLVMAHDPHIPDAFDVLHRGGPPAPARRRAGHVRAKTSTRSRPPTSPTAAELARARAPSSPTVPSATRDDDVLPRDVGLRLRPGRGGAPVRRRSLGRRRVASPSTSCSGGCGAGSLAFPRATGPVGHRQAMPDD